MQYKWYGNKSDMYSYFPSKQELPHNYTLDIFRIVCTWSTRLPNKCAKPYKALETYSARVFRPVMSVQNHI